MHYLITYDISNNKQRFKAARVLDDYGKRVQESVFELPELDDKIWESCVSKLRKNIKLGKADSIRVYPMCESCRGKIMVIGNGERPMDAPERYII